MPEENPGSAGYGGVEKSPWGRNGRRRFSSKEDGGEGPTTGEPGNRQVP